MSPPNEPSTAAGLRACAKGDYTYEAAVELLIRAWGGRLAGDGNEWIQSEGPSGYSIHAREAARAAEGGVLSGGEQRLMAIVAALADGGMYPVNLSDAISGLDREAMALVLAALAHANGSHEHPLIIDGQWFRGEDERIARVGSLYPWPEDDA